MGRLMSVNQVGQLFVAKASKATTSALTTIGDIAALKRANGDVYMTYKEEDEGLIRTDIMTKGNVLKATSTSAKLQSRGLVRKSVALSADAVGGNPTAGQNYILNLVVRQFACQSDESTYIQYGIVRGTTGMTASTFYKSMALSIVSNSRRDSNKFFKVYVQTATKVDTLVTITTTLADLTGTYVKLIIEEIEQPWSLGKIEEAPVFFSLVPKFVTVDGVDASWGTLATEVSTIFIDNGKKIAEMEFFTAGERGDLYRGVGYPDNYDTTYLVDASKKYHTVVVHYFYTGAGHAVQRSEKDLILVMPGSTVAETTKANAIISALATALDMTIAAVED